MAHPLFTPEIKFLLQENDAAGMKEFCESLHPATVAEALVSDLPVDQVWRFLRHTSIKNQAAIFEYLPIEGQVQMVEGTGREHMAELIKNMSHDDRGDLMRRLMPKVSESLLRLVDEADRRDIATLVSQEPNTAGALMTTDYAWVPPHLTASEALDRLRLQAPEKETIYYIFVLDEGHRLIGVISIRDLILAPRHSLIKDLMEDEVVSVRASDDRDKVAKTLARFDLIAIPVVDEQNRMVGIITHDDVMDVVVEEATEDAHRMGGVAPMAENYLTANFVTVWRKRAFWLSMLFAAELLTFSALEFFGEAINKIVILALFVPLCISTGGNSGSQAATLITRAMALGQVSLRDWFTVLRHELGMGVVLGLTLGVIAFARGTITDEDMRGNLEKRHEEFVIKVPMDKAAEVTAKKENEVWAHLVPIPTGNKFVRMSFPGGLDVKTLEQPIQVLLPNGRDEIKGQEEMIGDVKYRVFTLPAESKVRSAPVNRWALAFVIAQAVAAICLWGTLIGSMLPLLFRRINVDPGIASSPFVATAVDVTGIIIYFTIASIWLL